MVARWIVALTASLLLAGAASAGDSISPDDVQGPLTWGETTRVMQLRHLYFSGQPDRDAIASARDAGVTLIIDLRAPEEVDFDARGVSEGLGLRYENVPVAGPRFERDAFEEVESLVKQNEGEKVLIYCTSGNRAAGWLATHLVSRHDMSEEDALAVAKKAGVTKQGIVDRVHAYVSTPEKP